MSISRRKLLGYGAAATTLAARDGRAGDQIVARNTPPLQVAADVAAHRVGALPDRFDMRDYLNPKRLTLVMWDVAYALRHVPGGSFADYDRVLDETAERGYNTVRIDPMPQWIDLSKPNRILHWPDPKWPFQPWLWTGAVTGPVGLWIIEFMEKLRRRPQLNYTLSAWWLMDPPPPMPAVLRRPANHIEGAEMWAMLLTEWKRRFGFEGLVYVDIANESPFFFPDFQDRIKKETGAEWGVPQLSAMQIDFVAKEINGGLKLLRREFPELRFTTAMHGDTRWLDIPVELDCLDIHFYADADARWTQRTRFDEDIPTMFHSDTWFADLSQRAQKTHRSMAPMLRARQRAKLSDFAAWAARRGMPLTCSEGWAAWYWIDDPKLDWGWLLDWASWAVEDSIDNRLWGWTPHDYCQPQFANWRDVKWHRKLTERFLSG